MANKTNRQGDVLMTEIEQVIRSENDLAKSMQQVAAKAMLAMAKDGRVEYLNRLYQGITNHSKYGLAILFVRQVEDKFNSGGIRNPEEPSKWAIRPVRWFTFQQGPKEKDSKGFPMHFKLVDIPALEKTAGAEQAKHAKAGKQNVIKAGVDGLSFQWQTAAGLKSAIEKAYESADYTKDAIRFLTKVAQNAGDLHLTKQEVTKRCNALGLDANATMKVMGYFSELTFAEKQSRKVAEAPEGQKEETEKLIKQNPTPNNVSAVQETVNA